MVERCAAVSPLRSVDAGKGGNYLLGLSTNVGWYLIMGCLASYAVLLGTLAKAPEAFPPTKLGEYERQACQATFTIQAGSIIVDLLARKHLSASQFWVVRTIFVVKLIACVTNAAILFSPSPLFVVDAVTKRPNCMLRWTEWTVLAFMMTFVVESIDATRSDLRTVLVTASCQGLSTLCGMLLPLVSRHSTAAWGALLVLSFALFAQLLVRYRERGAHLQRLRSIPTISEYTLHRSELATQLFGLCVLTWTALVVVWCVDAAVRLMGVRMASEEGVRRKCTSHTVEEQSA